MDRFPDHSPKDAGAYNDTVFRQFQRFHQAHPDRASFGLAPRSERNTLCTNGLGRDMVAAVRIDPATGVPGIVVGIRDPDKTRIRWLSENCTALGLHEIAGTRPNFCENRPRMRSKIIIPGYDAPSVAGLPWDDVFGVLVNRLNRTHARLRTATLGW